MTNLAVSILTNIRHEIQHLSVIMTSLSYLEGQCSVTTYRDKPFIFDWPVLSSLQFHLKNISNSFLVFRSFADFPVHSSWNRGCIYYPEEPGEQ